MVKLLIWAKTKFFGSNIERKSSKKKASLGAISYDFYREYTVVDKFLGAY